MANRTIPVEFQRAPLWDRLQGYLTQVCTEGYEFVLASSLEVEGREFRVTREIGGGEYAMDLAISACLFSLAHDIHDHIPRGARLLFAAPAEWEWCPQQQFVAEPLRFFFERGGRGNWYLNMAALVALAPRFEGVETLINSGHVDSLAGTPCPAIESGGSEEH